MLTFLRMQMALLPMLWSMYQDGGSGDGDSSNAGDATANTNGGNQGESTTYRTQEDFDRVLSARLERERKKLRDEITKELSDAAEAKRLEEDQKWQELAEKRAAEKRELEAQLAAREAQERERVLRYEIRDAARDLNFADPDDAYLLIDRSTVEFAEDGSPSNVSDIVKALSERKPHLIKSDKALPMGARETGKASQPREMTKEDLKNKYLKQAGRLPA